MGMVIIINNLYFPKKSTFFIVMDKDKKRMTYNVFLESENFKISDLILSA